MEQAICMTATLLLAGVPDLGWLTFEAKEGGFSVMLPKTPAERTQRIKTAMGQLDVHLFVVEKSPASYVVSYSDVGEADAKKATQEKRLDHARDGAVSSTRGKLRSEKKLEFEGCPARELWIENEKETVIRMRIVVSGRRLYQLMVIGPGAVAQSREAAAFLDSFKLIR